jgi:hypothetical protein
MKRLASAAALTLFFALAPVASADPIRIVEGSVIWTAGAGGFDVSLVGDSEGFRYSATGHPGLVGAAPWNVCDVPSCVPGTPVSLEIRTGGTTIGGTASFRGETFNVGSQNPDSAHITLRWNGVLPIATDFAGGTLTAPFVFGGDFAYPGPPNNTLSHIGLTGNGTASLTFAPWDHPDVEGAFSLTAVRYDFAAGAPVPEPASMLLIGTGLAGLAAVRRRQR